MTKKIDTIIDPTQAVVKFGNKVYKIKRLKLGTILKIVNLLKDVGDKLAQSVGNNLENQEGAVNDIVLVLSALDEDVLYELICLVLNNGKCDEDKVKEVEENFNLADFVKLVRIILEFEDIKTLFLELKRASELIAQEK